MTTAAPVQLTFDAALPRVCCCRICRRFRDFHMRNPHVYRKLVQMARDTRGRGFDTYGVAALIEVCRWHTGPTDTTDDFKINSDYASRYARMIAIHEPDLRGFFEMRRLSTPECVADEIYRLRTGDEA